MQLSTTKESIRSCCPKVFLKKSCSENFYKVHKDGTESLLSKEDSIADCKFPKYATLSKVFSFEIQIFRNKYSLEQLQTAASELSPNTLCFGYVISISRTTQNYSKVQLHSVCLFPEIQKMSIIYNIISSSYHEQVCLCTYYQHVINLFYYEH